MSNRCSAKAWGLYEIVGALLKKKDEIFEVNIVHIYIKTLIPIILVNEASMTFSGLGGSYKQTKIWYDVEAKPATTKIKTFNVKLT